MNMQLYLFVPGAILRMQISVWKFKIFPLMWLIIDLSPVINEVFVQKLFR